MTDLSAWAARHAIPPAALAELRAMLTGVDTTPTRPAPAGSEAAAQQAIRLEASRNGLRLWRNNVGAAYTETGAVIRYGLANDSAALNKQIKSSDLIGIKPVRIGGRVIGQFVAREVKRPGWRYRGTMREQAQARFLEIVAGLGGDAGFCTGYDISY